MMRVVDTYVNVLNPHRVEAVVVYRNYDEATSSWGDARKTHISPFGSVNEWNINAARSFIRTFEIGAQE